MTRLVRDPDPGTYDSNPAGTGLAPPPTTTAPAPPPTSTPTSPSPVPSPLPALPTPVLPAPPDPVGIPQFLAEDYAEALRSLLPRGRVWPTDPDSVQQLVLLGIGKTFERSDGAGMAILAGAVPGSPLSGFLPEWEATLGLPDPCLGTGPTFAQRFAQVGARFVAIGGSSRAALTAFAAALGFTITITAYSATFPGPSGYGFTGTEWNFVLGITVTANTSGLDNSVLECELNAIKPAEATIILLSTPTAGQPVGGLLLTITKAS